MLRSSDRKGIGLIAVRYGLGGAMIVAGVVVIVANLGGVDGFARTRRNAPADDEHRRAHR